jgi:hypothetical protein
MIHGKVFNVRTNGFTVTDWGPTSITDVILVGAEWISVSASDPVNFEGISTNLQRLVCMEGMQFRYLSSV